MKNRNKQAFTLIELLVVVLIIGILAAVAVPQYTFAVEKARLSESLTVMSSLEKAIDVWLLEHGTPTETIYFLGDNVNGKGQLDIDFESGMDCSLYEGQACGNKNFLYEAYCPSDFCTVWAHRLANGESNGDEPYVIVRAKKFSGGAWHGSECDYYPDVSAISKKICNMLKSQDDGYNVCENC